MKRKVWFFIFLLFFTSFFVLLHWFFLAISAKKQSQFITIQSQAEILNRKMHQIQVVKRQTVPIRVPILMYHYVENVTDLNDTLRMSQNIPPQIFEEQLVTLLNSNYTPIFMSDLTNYFLGKVDLPPKPIVLTFDDGYADFYTDVFPILKKYQVKAVNYVVSGFVGRDKNYLTLLQLEELAASPLVEIGAHSVSHQDLPYLTIAEMQNEISNSKLQLEYMVKKPISHFAYPYGRYTKEAILFVEQSGFDSAVTTDEGTIQTYESRYIFKRIRPGRFTQGALLDRIK